MEPLCGYLVNYHLIFFYGYGTATRLSFSPLLTLLSHLYSLISTLSSKNSIPISYQMSFGMPRLFTLSRSD